MLYVYVLAKAISYRPTRKTMRLVADLIFSLHPRFDYLVLVQGPYWWFWVSEDPPPYLPPVEKRGLGWKDGSTSFVPGP